MNTFDKKSWTPQAATRWQSWCVERMRLCKTDAAGIAAHAVLDKHKESLAACRNTIDGFLRGDAVVLQRLFNPHRKTRYPTEERLQRIAVALSTPAEQLGVAALRGKLAEVMRDEPQLPAAATPWHPQFAHVARGTILAPTAWLAGSPAAAQGLADLPSKLTPGSWVWLTGAAGSGRKTAAHQLARQLQDSDSPLPVVVLTHEPEEGWAGARKQHASAVVLAIVAVRPALWSPGVQNDLELQLGPWGRPQLEACAQQLADQGIVAPDDAERLSQFAERVGGEPELLGPDKRPEAVLALAARVLRGEAVADAAAVRRTIRQSVWQSLPDRYALLRTDGAVLLQALWSAALQQAQDGRWWRLSPEQAQDLLATGAAKVWKQAAAREIGELLAAAKAERGKDQRTKLLDLIGQRISLDGSLLLKELMSAGLLVADGDAVVPENQTHALLEATARLPDAIAAAVVVDPNNLSLPCEWAVQGHDPQAVAKLLASCPLHARPFAWRWLLAFAWIRRDVLPDQWVKRFVQPAWAGLTLATLDGYADVQAYRSCTVGNGDHALYELLRNTSLHWSGVLPDLDPEQPRQALQRLLPPDEVALLAQWQQCKAQLVALQPAGATANRWPSQVVAMFAHSHALDDRYTDAQRDPVHVALWWLAPGQLLGLCNAHARFVRLDRLGEDTGRRMEALFRRADRGEQAAQRWLAGGSLALTENGLFVQTDETCGLWEQVELTDRLRWLCAHMTGTDRDLVVLGFALGLQGARLADSSQPAQLAQHWSTICAVLSRQTSQSRKRLIAQLALPWRPRWFAWSGFPLADALALAEHFGLKDVLAEALSAPQRWLSLQRAAVVRGQTRLYVPKDLADEHGRLLQAFCAEQTDPWTGLAQAEAYAGLAAEALHRLGEPQHLQQRWQSAPSWQLTEQLAADLQWVTRAMSLQWGSTAWSAADVPRADAAATAQAIAWLDQTCLAADALPSLWTLVQSGDQFALPSIQTELQALLAVARDNRTLALSATLHGPLRYQPTVAKAHPKAAAFWRELGTPVEAEPTQEARIDRLVRYAVWLLFVPGLVDPSVLRSAQSSGAAQPSAPAPRNYAHDRALLALAQGRALDAARRLLALGDDAPLQDLLTKLLARTHGSQDADYQDCEQLEQLVKADPKLAERLIQLASKITASGQPATPHAVSEVQAWLGSAHTSQRASALLEAAPAKVQQADPGPLLVQVPLQADRVKDWLDQVLTEESAPHDEAAWRREEAARALAIRGLHGAAVRSYLLGRLQRLIQLEWDSKSVAYAASILLQIGTDAWRDALALVPTERQLEVQLEALQQGWCGEQSSFCLHQLLTQLLPAVPDAAV